MMVSAAGTKERTNEETRIGRAVRVDERELALNDDAGLWSARSQSVGSVVGVSKGSRTHCSPG